jgi:hypothetical protein
MTWSSINRDAETPDWLLWFFDWVRNKSETNDKGGAMNVAVDTRKPDLENRLDAAGWGLLFLLMGALSLPNGSAEYASAAAVGALMVGLNLFRVFEGVPVRWFSVILGAVMLAAGTGALVGYHMDVFVLFFVLAGIVTLGGAIVRTNRAVAE